MKKTIPKNPKTKRDLHFYNQGAREQAEIFSKTYESKGYRGWEDEIDVPEIKKINNRSEVAASKADWIGIILLVIGVVLILLYAMHSDQESLRAGLIH